MQIPAALIAPFFFIIILALNWFGYRTRKRISRLYPNREIAFGTAEGSLLGLMALLLAFSFNMAAAKHEGRRQFIIEEANAISSAILRSGLLPDSSKQAFLPHFKQYVEARINYYDAGENPEKIKTALDDAELHLKSIWNQTEILSKNPDNRTRADQMATLVTSMKNIATTREAARVEPVPALIILVLLALVFVSSFVIGFSTKPGHRNVFLSIAFALMTTIVLYLIMELSRPTRGYINLQNAEQKMVDLRKMFK